MIVIKIGGAEGIGPRPACEDIAALGAAGQPVLVVHGGSHETNQLSERLGIEPRFITSPSGHTSRYTDEAAIDVFQMACRRLNARIVRMLREMGVDAVGLSGIDGGLWAARRKGCLLYTSHPRRRTPASRRVRTSWHRRRTRARRRDRHRPHPAA